VTYANDVTRIVLQLWYAARVGLVRATGEITVLKPDRTEKLKGL
jgi:hypothetical protein